MKDTRVNIRIPHAEKELWETTASEYGMTLTEFVTRSVRSNLLQLQQAKTGFSTSANSSGGTTAVTTNYLSWGTGVSST